jgi:hypothetical protein
MKCLPCNLLWFICLFCPRLISPCERIQEVSVDAEGEGHADGAGMGRPRRRAGGGAAGARTEGGAARRLESTAPTGENIPAASRIPKSTPLPLLRPRLRPRWLRMPVVRRGDTRRACSRCSPPLLRRRTPLPRCPSSAAPQAQPMTAAPRALASHEMSGGGGHTHAQREDGGGRGWWTTAAAYRRQWADDRNLSCWTTVAAEQPAAGTSLCYCWRRSQPGWRL